MNYFLINLFDKFEAFIRLANHEFTENSTTISVLFLFFRRIFIAFLLSYNRQKVLLKYFY